MNIASRSLSEGAAASLWFDVPEITRLWLRLTMSVLLGSLTVRVPVLVSPAFVSINDALVFALERPLAVILKLSMAPAKRPFAGFLLSILTRISPVPSPV